MKGKGVSCCTLCSEGGGGDAEVSDGVWDAVLGVGMSGPPFANTLPPPSPAPGFLQEGSVLMLLLYVHF